MDPTTPQAGSLYAWVKKIPASKTTLPDGFLNRSKYFFWKLYTPLHQHFRDAFLYLGIVKHTKRQDFILGTISPNISIQEFIEPLVSKGFGNHFIAWKEEGEIIGLRYVPNFERQYHLRIFADKEIRGHYEYTPECHPILHMNKVDFKDGREFFSSFFNQNHFIPHKH